MKTWIFHPERMLRSLVPIAFGVFTAMMLCGAGQAEKPLLLRNPSLSQRKIAFLYANDIWTVARVGGVAQRLTSQDDVTAGPFYSPDGGWIAYSADRHGAENVYVMSASGGVPRQLTWDNSGHTGRGNVVIGWTPDGKDVLFDFGRYSYSDFSRYSR